MPGGGADELAALLRQQTGDALRGLAPQRLAGEDHGAGIDVVGMQLRARIGLVDDLAERRIVDALLALVGGERHRRLVERLARDHVVAAGQVLAITAQLDAREDDLRARGADVDADADQRDVVLQPDRVLLDRAVVVELEMVVVVIGDALVLVAEIVAQEMIGKRMAGGSIRIGLVVLSIRHRAFSSTLTVTALAAATRQARYQIRTSNGACGTA